MDRFTIHCASCGQAWLAVMPFSVYERQAVESCPCPRCAAYTLCCHEPDDAPRPHAGRGIVAIPAARG